MVNYSQQGLSTYRNPLARWCVTVCQMWLDTLRASLFIFDFGLVNQYGNHDHFTFLCPAIWLPSRSATCQKTISTTGYSGQLKCSRRSRLIYQATKSRAVISVYLNCNVLLVWILHCKLLFSINEQQRDVYLLTQKTGQLEWTQSRILWLWRTVNTARWLWIYLEMSYQTSRAAHLRVSKW